MPDQYAEQTVVERRMIRIELDELAASVAGLEEVVAAIGDRIAPVLGPERPSRDAESKEPEVECALASELQSQRIRIQAKARLLSELFERIEL